PLSARAPRSTLFPYTTLFRSSLNIRFRRAAMNAYGYGRGSLSKAAAEALAEWCKEKESKQTLETNKAKDPAPLENPSAPKPHPEDRKSTRLNSSHVAISYAVF